MELILREIITRCDAGERLALCVVVGSRGSTPQEAGAKMLVLGDGRTIGTLGGGCVEAEVRRRALELLPAGASKKLQFRLDHDYGWDDGLICGGTMDILVHLLDGQSSVAPFARATEELANGRSATIALPDPDGGEAPAYVDQIEPAPRLVIAGAGHVGQALAEIAASLGFEVTIIDDRADCASSERFPRAHHRIVGNIEAELRRFPIDPHTYVVIVTRGHRHDGQALGAVLDSPAKYVGLIGSKRKVMTIFGDLLAQGAEIDALCKVHAPVGLEIGAVAVPEIALSIAAELIAVRRGRDDAPASPMKFDPHRLRELLAKHSSPA
ncbi:MAG TPA: XdhC/CoxI family protein [Tepidisphaeraceae bacterium]|nr:XdhC/CoxI family protein [Tepidisphaeraceae bacterium]